MPNTWFKRVDKRKVTFRMGECEREIYFVFIKRTPTVFTQQESNSCGVSTCVSGNGDKQEENKECSVKDGYCDKKDKLVKRFEGQETMCRKSN